MISAWLCNFVYIFLPIKFAKKEWKTGWMNTLMFNRQWSICGRANRDHRMYFSNNVIIFKMNQGKIMSRKFLNCLTERKEIVAFLMVRPIWLNYSRSPHGGPQDNFPNWTHHLSFLLAGPVASLAFYFGKWHHKRFSFPIQNSGS